MVFVLIGVAIMLYSIFDFKKSFLIFLIFNMTLTGNVVILSTPGGSTLTLNLCMLLFYTIVYFAIEKRRFRAENEFPFRVPFILVSISMIVSAVFSWAGFRTVFTRTISDIVTQYVFIVLIWHLVETEKDYRFVFKGITIVIIFSALYAFYEYFTKSNPILSYEMSMVKNQDAIRDFSYAVDIARGYRAQSIFESAIGAGINWLMYAIWVFTTYLSYQRRLPWKYVAFTAAALGILASFFAKSRSPIVFFIIGILCFFKPRNRKFYYLGIVGITGFIIAWTLFADDVSAVFLSLLNSDYQTQVSGSTVSLRLRTLRACLQVVKNSPIVGVGIKFWDYVNDATVKYELHGMESIWFVSLVYYGIIGICTQLMMAYYSIRKIPHRYKSRAAFVFALAFWVTYTMTTLPGMLVYIYYLIYFYFIKKTNTYHNRIVMARETVSVLEG